MKSDGLIGFAFDSLSDGVSSLLTSLKTQGKIKNRQFAIYLSEVNSYSDLPNLGSSNLMIDGYNLTAYSSENSFTYVSLANSDGYWEIPCDAAYFDGKTYTGSPTAIIDTGTSVIIGPKNDVNNILLGLYNNHGCKLDSSSELYCSCTGTYPNMTFQFSGHNFTLQPSDYFEVYEGYCFPALYYSSQLSTWLLGDSFIRRFYINFDIDGMRMGFAQVGISTSESASSSTGSTTSGSSESGGSSSSANSTSSSSGSSNNSTSTSSNSTSTSSSGSGTSSNSTSTSTSSSNSSSSSSSSSSSLNGSSSSSESFETWKIVLIVVLPTAFFIIVFVISAVIIAKIIKKRKQKGSEIKLSGNIEVKVEDAKIENKDISKKHTMEKYEEDVVRQELNRNHG
ncbi:unnamed protein product [Blepharisma stoltei]|uniref:Peptidase A1 domain-containing protein n=1 Tax=Blepharisma stoltei TaxID=1481888 RepID=A0AAU9KE85_9CILI|nr:unnamed protein product [Blepharisma stoltei]